MVSNFTRSLVVFMPNITTNNAITYTNSLFAVNDTDRNKCKPNEKLFGLLGSSSLHVNSPYSQVIERQSLPTTVLFRPQLFKRWIKCNRFLIHWIEIYPMDSAIHICNNWGQEYSHLGDHIQGHPTTNFGKISVRKTI